MRTVFAAVVATLVSLILQHRALAQEASRDLTLEGMPTPESGGISNVGEAVKPVTSLSLLDSLFLLDDFNRPDGPIGGAWTDRAASFFVFNNQARGGDLALATYNAGTGSILEAQAATDRTSSIQYVALVSGYSSLNSSYFLKVQSQTGGGMFEYGACYLGNNASGGTFGLGFFALNTPFASGLLTSHYDSDLDVVTLAITGAVDLNGDPVDDQSYECCCAPVTGGSGIGMGGYVPTATLDNFSSNENGCQMTFTAGSRTVVPGSSLGLTISLKHNRDKTVHGSFFVRLQDLEGRILTEETTRALTIRYLDDLTITKEIQIPRWVTPGEYVVLVGIDGMRQGRALERVPVVVVSAIGKESPIQIDQEAGIPSLPTLEQNYPNPFNPSTTFSFSVPTASHTSLLIYNDLGQEIAAVVDEVLEPGRYTRTWNATDYPSGVYTCRLVVGNVAATRKVLLVK